MSKLAKLVEIVKNNKKKALLTFLVLSVIGMFIPEEETEVVGQETPQEEVQTEQVVEKETEEPSKEEVEEVAKKVKEAMIKSAMDRIEESAKPNYDYTSIDYNEQTDTITLNVANDGVAIALNLTKQGTLDKSQWEELMSGIDMLSKTLKEQMGKTFGIDDVDVSVAVLNDLDKDKILYLSNNGQGLYNALQE